MTTTIDGAPTLARHTDKARILARLARAEGQLRGIQKMVSEERDCEVIAQQLSAARGALDRAFYDLISCALETKLSDLTGTDPEARDKIADVARLLTKYA